MKLADYPPEVLDRIQEMRYDWIIEKHDVLTSGKERVSSILRSWTENKTYLALPASGSS